MDSSTENAAEACLPRTLICRRRLTAPEVIEPVFSAERPGGGTQGSLARRA